MSDLDLVALKPMKYLTRRLQPGDDLTAKNRRDFTLYTAINKAAPPDDPRAVALKSTAAKLENEGDAALALARSHYKEVMGKQPYHGWDIETIREKIAES